MVWSFNVIFYCCKFMVWNSTLVNFTILLCFRIWGQKIEEEGTIDLPGGRGTKHLFSSRIKKKLKDNVTKLSVLGDNLIMCVLIMCCIDEAETANERKISGLTESINEPADIDTFDIKLFLASTRFLIDLEKSKRCVSGLVVSTSHHALHILSCEKKGFCVLCVRLVCGGRDEVGLGCVLGQTQYPDTRLESWFRGWQVKTNDPNVILDSVHSGSIQSKMSPVPTHPRLIHFQGNGWRNFSTTFISWDP